MYFNPKIHILSNALIIVSVVNTITEGFAGGIRLVFRSVPSLLPDMLNSFFQNTDSISALIRIVFAAVVFSYSWKKLQYYKGLVGAEDLDEMGKLQAEVLKENKSTLKVSSIERLVLVWGVILIGVEFVYDVTSGGYTRFIDEISGLLNPGDPASMAIFVKIYNNSHGFKYIGMLIAILMGVIITGIFLADKYLVIAAAISTVIFLVAFFAMQMQTFTIFNRMVGIVWTSVVFHTMQTIGLLLFSLYIRHRYNGL